MACQFNHQSASELFLKHCVRLERPEYRFISCEKDSRFYLMEPRKWLESFLAFTDIHVILIVYFLGLLKDFHPSQCFYMSKYKQGDKGKFVYLYWEQNALAWYIIHAVYILLIIQLYNVQPVVLITATDGSESYPNIQTHLFFSYRISSY